MLLTYEKFCEILLKHIGNDKDFYDALLIKIIENPERYSGLFRLSSVKAKLIQNITQSREIKFGDFLEELVTEYIAKLGYEILNKNLGFDENGDALNVDQIFRKENNLYIVEMKIRDDHDSSKKRGQFENFLKKINIVKNLYKNCEIFAYMWFVDETLHKNKNYYLNKMNEIEDPSVTLGLFYGESFFNELENGNVAWNELIDSLFRYKKEYEDSNLINVPNFASSEIIYQSLLKLPSNMWKKLISNQPKYIQLRKELFDSGDNLKKVMAIRGNK